MIGASVRRLGWMIVVIWFVVSATFVVTVAIPADPAKALLGPHATPEAIERVRAHYCLDRGAVAQYGCWISRVAHGDLGESYRSKRAVTAIIADRIWPTTQLALAAIALQLVIGVPFGVAAALRRGRWLDHALHLASSVAQSVPAFFAGMLLLYLFAYRWGWFPIGGYGTGGWDRLAHLALPAMTLALIGVTYYARVVRTELVDVVREDYVRTARAKGLPERVVIGRHALPNAVGPLLALLGLDLGVLLGGAIVIELIFAWPGLGREVLQAIFEVDIPLILGVVLVSAIAIAVANLIVDLIQLWLDPRLREST
ncbi:MAG TPA: ABC transporter permease [Kofleriaceae bacterium]|jgi:peptide/nickel transport system permease protein